MSILGRLVGYETYKPISGIEVTLESNGQVFRAVTDAIGQYGFTLTQEGLVKVEVHVPYSAFDAGYGGIREVSNGPNQTVLEYEDSISIGQCRFKELLIVRLP
jgi:hypothetical protein